jgi:acyl carrier protein
VIARADTCEEIAGGSLAHRDARDNPALRNALIGGSAAAHTPNQERNTMSEHIESSRTIGISGNDLILETICAIFGAELGVPAEWVGTAESIREIPGMESLRMLRAVTKVEKHFGIELPDEAVFNIECVDQLARVVSERLAEIVHA